MIPDVTVEGGAIWSCLGWKALPYEVIEASPQDYAKSHRGDFLKDSEKQGEDLGHSVHQALLILPQGRQSP